MAADALTATVAYRPLVDDEIRLIRLLGRANVPALGLGSLPTSSHGDDRLECTIEHHQLSRAPPYSALSYTWGDQQHNRHLYANGRSYVIGVNAVEALQHLRDEGDVCIWIDQICINQNDPVEKAHQVQQMWNIYSSAEKVVVWLGAPADDSDFIITHLLFVAELLRARQHERVIRMHSDTAFLRRISVAFRAFCLRSYWRRVWVIQEFAVGQKVVIACGHAKLEFADLRDAVLHVNNRPGQITSPDDAEQQLPGYMKTRAETMRAFRTSANSFLESVMSRRRRYQLRVMSTQPSPVPLADWEMDIAKQQETLFRVLVTTHVLEIDHNRVEATNPVDLIFSVLHFAEDKSAFVGLPDYQRRCEEIFQDVARRMLTQGHIDVLSYCQQPQQTGLATWAPDWRKPIKKPCGGSPWVGSIFASGDTLGQQVVEAPDSDRITLRGVLVDSIKQVGGAWDPDWLAPLDCVAALAYLEEIRNLCAASYRHSAYQREGRDDVDMIRIAIADRYGYRDEEHHPELLEAFQLAVEYMKAQANISGSDPSAKFGLEMEDEIGWQAPWYTFCLKNLHSRRPFVSETGYVGLAPMRAMPGDQVVIFLGGRTPYVIREVSDGAAAELIGECYTHGVMHGEFMESNPDVRQFTLQ